MNRLTILTLLGAGSPSQAQNVAQESEPLTLDPVRVTGVAPRGTLRLNEIQPTASKLPLSSAELPVSIHSINAGMIRERGFSSAVDAVGSIPGVVGGARYGGLPDLSVRGFTTDDLAVFTDGINLPIGQNLVQANADAFHYDRIDVLKGPSSLLYGQGAIGGAVNYVSKAPSERLMAETFATYGSWDKVYYGGGVGGPIGLPGVFGRFDVSRLTGGRFPDRTDREWNTFSGSVRWDTTPKWSNLVQLKYSDIEEQDPWQGAAAIDGDIIPELRRRNFNDDNSWIRTHESKIQLTSTVEATENLRIRNTAWGLTHKLDYSTIEASYPDPLSPDSIRIVRDRLPIFRDHAYWGDRLETTWDGDVFDRRTVTSVGGEYGVFTRRNSFGYYDAASDPAVYSPIDPATFTPTLGPEGNGRDTGADAYIHNYAVFGESMFEPWERTKFLGGLRQDFYAIDRQEPRFTDSNNESFTYRGGVVFDITKNVHLYGSYSAATRPAVALSAAITPAEVGTLAAEDENNDARQIEFGVKNTLWKGRVETTLAAFDIEKSNILGRAGNGAQRIWYLIGEQRSRGVEAIVEVRPGEGWHAAFDVTALEAEFGDFRNRNLSGAVTSDFSGHRPPNVPEVSLGSRLLKTFELGSGISLSLGGDLRYVGNRADNNANTIYQDAYMTANLHATVAWKNWTLTGRVRNVNDEEYAVWSALGAPEALRDRQLLLADPRSFEITARYTF